MPDSENYFKKYRPMFDKYGVTEAMYMFDMIEGMLKRLGLLE